MYAYFVRHGITRSDMGNPILKGTLESSLSDIGIINSYRIATALSTSLDYESVLYSCSPCRRTRQTDRILIDVAGGEESTVDQRAIERNCGSLQGLPVKAIREAVCKHGEYPSMHHALVLSADFYDLADIVRKDEKCRNILVEYNKTNSDDKTAGLIDDFITNKNFELDGGEKKEIVISRAVSYAKDIVHAVFQQYDAMAITTHFIYNNYIQYYLKKICDEMQDVEIISYLEEDREKELIEKHPMPEFFIQDYSHVTSFEIWEFNKKSQEGIMRPQITCTEKYRNSNLGVTLLKGAPDASFEESENNIIRRFREIFTKEDIDNR